MSRLAERGASSACRLAGPPPLPKPQPSRLPSPCLSSLSGVQQGRPWLGEAREAISLLSTATAPGSLHFLPSPLTPPALLRGPFGSPAERRNSGGDDWVEEAGVAEEGGVVSLGSPLPRGWGGRERLSRGRASSGGARPSVVGLEEAQIGTCGSAGGEGMADPQTGRVRLRWRTARGGPSGVLGSYSPGIPGPRLGKSPGAPPCSAPAPPPPGRGAAPAAGP